MRLIILSALLASAGAGAAEPAAHQTVEVTLGTTVEGATSTAPQGGRLIVFAQRIADGKPVPEEVDLSPFSPTDTAIAARDVIGLAPGQSASVDGDNDSFPTPFSALPPGRYAVQAVLDRNHDYNYGGRGPGDIVSPVTTITLPGPARLTLDHVLPAVDDAKILSWNGPEKRAETAAAMAALKPVDVPSAALSAFYGRPIAVHGYAALAPGYGARGAHFPVVYEFAGYGGSLQSAKLSAAIVGRDLASGALPPMIHVFLDQSSPRGTHEFADSVNNGPWGKALSQEVVPWVDRHFATDGRASSRFLTGHSSGGWAALWAQVAYPKTFGGSWPTSPDPSEFHDFTNVDLYAASSNAFRMANGEVAPLVRDKGKVQATFEQFARIERILGPVGGQLASFEWVFSPKGDDGAPMPLFDRNTGAVDPAVAAYWIDHYDVARLVERNWTKLRPDLDGKIHLFVGTADTFYLDGPAHRLEAVFRKLGAHEQFTYIPDRTHFDLYRIGDDRSGLRKQINREMYARARPAAARR
ncbi:alpha/beta hydrolase-fold protein [Sphingomonas sp. ASV193]|uniref:alpha/beta hydrolase n=1 Tax=Sphingomonas sp. ASV193 TaxID=3144405 RepID=UPI0032E87A85